MTPDDTQRIQAFIAKWQPSEGNEQANSQPFFLDLCAALGVAGPPPKDSSGSDTYSFEKAIKTFSERGQSSKRADFYKADCFLLEAKQGSFSSNKGHGKRGTKIYEDVMQGAFNQARQYIQLIDSLTKPPFLITCDIGYRFDIWQGFSGEYGSYGARQRVSLAELQQPEVFDRFVAIFTDPQSLNPEKLRAKVTREVAAELAKLSRWLEENPSPLAPLPAGEGNKIRLPSPAGRRVGDEGQSPVAQQINPSPLAPLPPGEGNWREWDGEFSRLTGRWRQIPDEFIERARELRKNQTPAETLLWELLRSRRFLEAKFRRQHKIGQFIADFYCHEARLVVELDGAVHQTQTLKDQDRDQWMQANGITVLRFSNDAAFDQTEAVLGEIAEVISPSPLASLPPGEGNKIRPPSPAGRRVGDEGQTSATQQTSPSPLAPLPQGEGKLNHPQAVAQFLMRCIFTMFAEDVELLPGEVFTKALRDRWIPNPATFKPEIEQLWQTMNTGGTFGFERVLQFNGSFFKDATAFDLPQAQLEVLLAAAEKDWKEVEPAIFGTLVERALEKKERSRLGAHYTPRSYVERLVRPVVMEPLRQEWDDIELEVKRLLEPEAGKEDPTATQRKKAEQEIRAFLDKLRQVKILDPACGTGNFLYVSLDLLKGLEAEVQTRLVDVAGNVQLNVLEQINPSQFLGIEINPRAAAIAELVIWIGYLQWFFKRYGNAEPPEPVLQAFNNIENRDAVLAYDGTEPDVDAKTGQVRTRWGGLMMRHPVTGEQVPDPNDQVVILKYLNARMAEWPEADYVVSNPPFLGNARMREALGDGYAEALRQAYTQIPETVDLVMYWWHKSAILTRASSIKRFGLITTNTIHQSRQRKVLDFHFNQKESIKLAFAIPDHPWVEQGAAVRISMTVGTVDISKISQTNSVLGRVVGEDEGQTPEETSSNIHILYKDCGQIFSNLKSGSDLTKCMPLKANESLCSRGIMTGSKGFQVEDNDYQLVEKALLRAYLNGRDLLHQSRRNWIIDTHGLSESNLIFEYPKTYQWLLNRVKPERETNNDKKLRDQWWMYRRSNEVLRSAIHGLDRYLVTVETSKHRVFVFLDKGILPDNLLVAIGLSDTYFLGVLSSKIHVTWALAAGGRLEDRPRYQKGLCFDPFPFPDPTPEQKQKIRDLGERLDAHRKSVQAAHRDITITGMYNLLEKLRAGQPFTEGDRAYNNRALVSTLKQIHDDLDVAVLEAYGWGDLVPMLGPSPLAPLPEGEGNQSGLPSPLGRRVGDEGQTLATQQINPSPLAPLPSGEGNQSELPSPLGRRVGDEGQTLNDIILENLVALNAQRAEEERNGHIRWLRPDYQAPDQAQPTQPTLDGILPAETPIIAPVEQQPWPAQPKAQLAAIRDLLRTSTGHWTVPQIAAQFTGKNTKKKLDAIAANLERLEWFGFVIAETTNSPTTWHYTELAKAA